MAETPSTQEIVAKALWADGNNRIGHRPWETVKDAYMAEAGHAIAALVANGFRIVHPESMLADVAAVWITHDGGVRAGAGGSILRSGDRTAFSEPSGLTITSEAFVGTRSEAGAWLDARSADWRASVPADPDAVGPGRE